MKMTRRDTRDALMKLLYQMDIHNELDNHDHFELLKVQIGQGSESEYAERIVTGFISNRAIIDEKIQNSSVKWSISRISKIDLAILRLATTEILFDESIPYQVSVNEAVELAKTYSGEESYSFVNGVLSKMSK